MSNPFVKATKEKAFLRLAMVGISGSGKTYSALNIARYLVPDGKIAVVDTEHGSASKYADLFTFDTVDLDNHQPKSYTDMIRAAAANGYDVVILDSLTHAWDALLEMKDKVSMQRGENSFTAWAKVNPHYNALIEAILGTDIHVIGTMRAKSDYVMEEYQDSQGNTRTKPVKVGMKAMQREGFEYEFDVVGNMDLENNLIIEKTRCPSLHGEVISKPGQEVADILRAWLSDGSDPAPQPPEPVASASNEDSAVDSTVTTSGDPVADIINANDGDLTDTADHWWYDNAQRQQFWIGNSRAKRTKQDAMALLGIPPSLEDNTEAQEWFNAMRRFNNPGEALAELHHLSKAQANS